MFRKKQVVSFALRFQVVSAVSALICSIIPLVVNITLPQRQNTVFAALLINYLLLLGISSNDELLVLAPLF